MEEGLSIIRRSWEADTLTSFESAGGGDSTLHCGLTEEDVLAFGLLEDLAPVRCAGRDIEISTIKPLQDPQLYRASSDQTSAATGEAIAHDYQPHAARRDSSCLLEEALTSIGLRQLLPQLSMTQAPVDAYSQMPMSPMSAGYMPFSTGAASVFVPCTDPQPLQVCALRHLNSLRHALREPACAQLFIYQSWTCAPLPPFFPKAQAAPRCQAALQD